MRPSAKLLAIAAVVALLLPGFAAAFAACAMADCPMMGGGAGSHDCCPTAPATISMDCCDHAPAARAATSFLPERDASSIVAIAGGTSITFAEPPVAGRFLPDRRQPHPPLDCLARTCVLRN